jgi:hypothetical protein
VRQTLILVAAALAGCSANGPFLPATEPIDPASWILTIRSDGAIVEGERRLTRDGLRERVGNSDHARNYRPILLEVPREGTLRCVKDAIEWLCQARCVNLGFRAGDTAVRLQTVLETDGKLRVYDGREEVLLVDHQDVIEVVTRVGIGGAIEVTSVQYTREYVYFPEKGEVVPEKGWHAWKGTHPACGTWSVDTLREFLRRPDLTRQTPYVGLEISWDDRVQDVLSCLSALRAAAGSRVEPILRPE